MMLTNEAKEQWTAKISNILVYEWVRRERLITNRCFIERKTFHPLFRLIVYVCSVCFNLFFYFNLKKIKQT